MASGLVATMAIFPGGGKPVIFERAAALDLRPCASLPLDPAALYHAEQPCRHARQGQPLRHAAPQDRAQLITIAGARWSDGAVEKTRTSTGFPPQRPQRCASTSSATTACQRRRRKSALVATSLRLPGGWSLTKSPGPYQAGWRRRALMDEVEWQHRDAPVAYEAAVRGDGGARRRDPRRHRARAGVAPGASAALHRRHQRARRRPGRARALPGPPHRARRPVHLSRAGPARRLCHARPEPARRRPHGAMCATSRNGSSARSRASTSRASGAPAGSASGSTRRRAREQDRRHRRARAPLGELSRRRRSISIPISAIIAASCRAASASTASPRCARSGAHGRRWPSSIARSNARLPRCSGMATARTPLARRTSRGH